MNRHKAKDFQPDAQVYAVAEVKIIMDDILIKYEALKSTLAAKQQEIDALQSRIADLEKDNADLERLR